MKIKTTDIADVKLIEPRVFADSRGFFKEAWNANLFAEAGLPTQFTQLNHSRSERDTLRGLHFQLGKPQGKLVRALSGLVFDVAVDLRTGSETFGRWVGFELSAENHRQLYIPVGFGHGFCVLSDTAEVEYLATDFYYPEGDRSLLWNDPAIGITWPVKNPILSDKDKNAPLLADLKGELTEFRNLPL